MRNKFKAVLGLLVGVGLVSVPAIASADEEVASLKMDLGLAIPLTSPQLDRFNVGGALMVKPLFHLTKWLDVGPSGSVMVLPSRINGVDAGTAWGLGGGVQVKRPHDGVRAEGLSPWLDVDLQDVVTGPLNRAALSVGAGISAPLNHNRTVWMGPFVRYQDIFDGTRPGYDTTDAHTLIVGVSLELSPRVHTKPAPEVTEELADRDHDGTPDVYDRCPDVPGPKDNYGCPYPEVKKLPVAVPPPAAPQQVSFKAKEIVYFPFDSNVLRPSENPALTSLVQALLSHVNYHVVIEGHSSNEGKPEKAAHNAELAQKRAHAVLEYLVSQGVDRKRLTAYGFGTDHPAVSNATEAGRVLNRRDEFVVTFVVGESK